MTQDAMIGKRISHFRILSKLGEGGMGVVYRAEDENLGRHVALKVLQSQAMGNEERRLRLMREARSAAAVTHPHIATVHEIDEVDGVIFIAMELVEGETLADTIDGSPISRRYALRYAIEIAEALSRAHKSGVVHRDLKPENVIISPDRHVKILDFGLAKLEEPESGPDQTTKMDQISRDRTEAGRVLGTPAYMSPEQARGLAVDARSDLFAFGILLYEMVTGTSPFRGETSTDTLLAIVRDAPVPARQRVPEIPPELERIIDKCLEKAPEDRYQHADDIVVDLRRLRRDTDSQPVSKVQAAAVASPSKTTVPWRPGPMRLLRSVPVVGGLLAVVLLAFGIPWVMRTVGEGHVRSLAVLPLQNLKDESDPERLGQIIQELIITDLSEIDALSVLSSQRLYDLKEQMGHGGSRNIDRKVATELAARAEASTMLTGTLSQLGERWILTCQLVDVSDGKVLKSERIDGADLYSMVDQLTAQIRNDLGLGEDTQGDLALAVKDKTTSSIEAYQHYLAGIDSLNTRRFEGAVNEMLEAVKIDPQFGAAYYKLAVAGWWFRPGDDWWEERSLRTPVEILEFLLSGELKISTKDRELAAAMLPLVKRDYRDGLDPFRRLVQSYPDEKEAWYGLGEAEWHGGGSPDSAVAAFERAVALDPSFQLPYDHIIDYYRSRHRYEEAAGKLRTQIAQNPENHALMADLVTTLIRMGDSGAAAELERALESAPDDATRRVLIHDAGHAYQGRGDDEAALAIWKRGIEIEPGRLTDEIATDIARYHADRWDFETAMKYFMMAHDADPERAWGSGILEYHYRIRGRSADAILIFRNWANQYPQVRTYHDNLIWASICRGDSVEAARALERALSLTEKPDEQAVSYTSAAEAHRIMGDLVTAHGLFRKALELDPESEWIRNSFALCLSMQRRYHESLGIIDALVAEDPNNTWYRTRQVRALLAANRLSEALSTAQNWPEAITREGGWHDDYMRTLIMTGRLREAEGFVETALSWFSSPGEVENFYHSAGEAYYDAGDPARGEEYFRLALAANPDRPDLFMRLRLTRELLKEVRLDDAQAELEEIRRYCATFRMLGPVLAEYHLLRGDLKAAERAVRDHLERSPTVAGQEMLVHILCAAGRHREAVPVARRVLAQLDNQEAHTLLSWVLIDGDIDLQEGIDLAERAIALPGPPFRAHFDSFQPSPRHCLGLAYLKQGEFSRAVGLLTQAAAERPDRTLIQEHLAEARAGGGS